jgi:hypothetical protein
VNAVRTPLAITRRRLPIICVCALGLVVFAGGVALAQEASLAAWRQTLAEAESSLKSMEPDDEAARATLRRQLAGLRGEITSWLASYPAAQSEAQPWIEPAPAGPVRLEDLAAEIGRLRAAIARIASSLRQGGEGGAFYLGRVDVAVTAKTAVAATTEMAPAGASLIEDLIHRLAPRRFRWPRRQLRIGQRNETTVYVGLHIRRCRFIDGIPVYTRATAPTSTVHDLRCGRAACPGFSWCSATQRAGGP